MLELQFTKPNEQSHLSFGFGKCEDGSSFICVDGNRDGYAVNPPERVSADEKDQSETMIVFYFFQEGSVKALIDAAQRALELLSYPEDHIVDANKKIDQVCPKCESMAHYDPHFGRVMCRQCGWMQED